MPFIPTEKRLRIGLTFQSVSDLPPHSTGPHGNDESIYAAAAATGYEGMQGGDARLSQQYGLVILGCGVIPILEDAEPFIAHWKNLGAESATCIVGYGYESDAEIDTLAGTIAELSDDYQLPVFIETHRASITQDAWRTVQLTRRLPKVRFNGDFSHWFTGQEMAYGDFSTRLERLSPIFDRIRFLHGRIGSRCCMQVNLNDGIDHKSIPYFHEFWNRAMQGFLCAPDSGRDLWFCPELLGTEYGYAHQIRAGNGEVTEYGDRWEQSKLLVDMAKECFGKQLSIAAGREKRFPKEPAIRM